MGHEQIGRLRKSASWNKVVSLITNGADVAKVAEATSQALEKSLLYVQNDAGFKEAVHLMTQLAVAGTKKDPAEHLASVGIVLSPKTSVADVVAAVTEALDQNVDATGKRSDFSECAHRALIGTLSQYLSNNQTTLFESSHEDVSSALNSLRKEKAFGEFSKSFFGKLTNECMDYFLSKTLATHVGEGQQFATMNQMAQFEAGLSKHCSEVAVIVEKVQQGMVFKEPA